MENMGAVVADYKLWENIKTFSLQSHPFNSIPTRPQAQLLPQTMAITAHYYINIPGTRSGIGKFACYRSSLNSFKCQGNMDNLYSYFDLQTMAYTWGRFGAPMVWVGLYVAAASLACFLAIAVDTFLGLRKQTLWFPCKIFTLNSATLTLLAVAMKLPLDLSNNMDGVADQMAKLSSTVFMCVVMTNFMPSVGDMDNKELLLNLAAMVILVITILVNVVIQLFTGVIFPTNKYSIGSNFTFFLHIIVLISMLILLVLFSVTALIVPTLRKILEVKYAKIHKVASFNTNEKITVEKLKENVAKYWMMAKTGSPRFVISRSATCFVSGTTSLLLVLLFVMDVIFFGFTVSDFSSNYKVSTVFIYMIQTVGAVVGIIAPTFRCFNAAIFNCSNKGRHHHMSVLSVETYWIQRLLEWKETSISLPIQNQKFQKQFQNTIRLILDFCIVIQKVIVVASKVIRCSYIFFVKLTFSGRCCIIMLKQMFVPKTSSLGNEMRLEAESVIEQDLRPYVLLLEGEEELPTKTLKNISDSLNRIIQKAKAQQPKYLKELLKKSKGFIGVAFFNNNQVLPLHTEEPPNGWSLTVATIASISIVVPSISRDVINNLLRSVNESLLYIMELEKSLDTTGNFVNTRKAANLFWFGVDSDCKWLDKDLREMALNGKTFLENVDCLAFLAERIITDFKANTNNDLIEDPASWPVRILAANSMYRISRAILLEYETSTDELTDYELFEKISIIIRDTIAACLTNLPRVIITKCYSCSIERREESVKTAARLLGETEEILEILQKLTLPNLTADQMGNIDDWSAMMKFNSPSARSQSHL